MPDNNVSPEIQEKINTFCREISVAHNLDEEIQAELHDHIEDKILAYLSGEEPLTEQDAYVLVCEHFGDTDAVKNLLQAVHVKKPAKTFIKKVVLHSLYALAIGFFGSLVASHHLIEFVMKDAIGSGANLDYYGSMGLIKLKVYSALIISAIFVFPYILYNILLSFPPCVTKYNEKSVLLHAFSSSILFGTGFVVYYFFIPHILLFISNRINTVTVHGFIAHILMEAILLGLIFMSPVMFSFLIKNGLINYSQLINYYKHGIVLIFITSAAITPPDPVSQLIVAVPLYLLYEIGFRIMKFSGRKSLAEIV